MNNKRSFLDIEDPFKKPEKSKRATYNPLTQEITEISEEDS